MTNRTKGFKFAFTRPDEVEVEVFVIEKTGEWYSAPVSNVVDVTTGYRIGRWLGPSRWTEDDARRYLGVEKT